MGPPKKHYTQTHSGRNGVNGRFPSVVNKLVTMGNVVSGLWTLYSANVQSQNVCITFASCVRGSYSVTSFPHAHSLAHLQTSAVASHSLLYIL